MRALVWLLLCASIVSDAGAATPTSAPAPLQARVLKRFAASEADQGVAVDAMYFYAIDNHAIGKYRKRDGVRVGGWDGGDAGPLRHINSCQAIDDELYCAHSNYPELPMASSVEVFDTASMQPVRSHSFGIREEGSLTWVQALGKGWLACFAHYESPRGVVGKDHRNTAIVAFDRRWRRTGGWMLPDSVLTRMAPHSASGGVIGPDHLLYLSGHDRPEIYVMAVPAQGPKLLHVATIEVPFAGQAFAWDPDAARTIYAVDRRQQQVLVIELPQVPVPAARHRFVDPP